MKLLFRHLLLLGAMIGLLWQGVAFASPPCAEMQREQAGAMAKQMAGMPDCDMSLHKSGKAPAPCKDMKAGCFAMVGCAALVSLAGPPPLAINRPAVTAIYQWTPTPVLHGRVVPPDPYPPSFLG